MNKHNKKLYNSHISNESVIQVQNNINIYGDSKIIAISSPRNDYHSVVAAKAIGEVYAMQEQSSLIIDCNMYNPVLSEIFALESTVFINDVSKGLKPHSINDYLNIVLANKTIYPTNILSSNEFQSFIMDCKQKYDHIILVMPSLVEHQDILILKDIITSCVLVALKKKTNRHDLFDCIQLLNNHDLPYIGTIFIK